MEHIDEVLIISIQQFAVFATNPRQELTAVVHTVHHKTIKLYY